MMRLVASLCLLSACGQPAASTNEAKSLASSLPTTADIECSDSDGVSKVRLHANFDRREWKLKIGDKWTPYGPIKAINDKQIIFNDNHLNVGNQPAYESLRLDRRTLVMKQRIVASGAMQIDRDTTESCRII